MESYIKYKRIRTTFENTVENVQTFLDDLSSNSWDIIYYDEGIKTIHHYDDTYVSHIEITVVVGKRQNNVI